MKSNIAFLHILFRLIELSSTNFRKANFIPVDEKATLGRPFVYITD